MISRNLKEVKHEHLKEDSLSDNKSTFEDDDKEITYWYREDFVKEFIDKLKEDIDLKISACDGSVSVGEFDEIIDKRAGGKL